MKGRLEVVVQNTLGTPRHVNSKPALVDFLGLGVQKAGTTWLHQILGAHPEIFVAQSDDKDLRFFSCFYDFGYGWYESHFKNALSVKRRGEFSTSYFYSKDSPERINAYNPKMRLIVSLRNPVDRLISHHRHEIRIGHVKSDLSLKRGIENNPSYIEQSMYFTQLCRWIEYFPLSSFHIMIFEEVFAHPVDAIRDLYDFLEVSSTFAPDELHKKVNVGRVPRSWLLDRSVTAAATNFRRFGLGWIVDKFKQARLDTLIARRNTQREDALSINNDDYEQLRKIFAIENEKLSRLLGRDLSVWDQ